MSLDFLYKGLILGFSVAAPVGPIGILCINRTIKKSYLSGIATGLGAATADLLYGLIAGLGLTIISNFLIEQKFWMQLIGLLFLFYLGIKTLTKKKSQFKENKIAKKGLFNDFLTTFILMITNPVTILVFLAFFAGMGLSNPQNDKLSSVFLVAGVFMGSGLWWLLLSGLTYKLKEKINNKFLAELICFQV